MSFFVRSGAKINVSLRITGMRPDGYHELRSLFFGLPSIESLTITSLYDHNVNDIIEVSGEMIQGRNILEDVLFAARKHGFIPPVHIRIVKNIPPGSGLGAGSGNAAALISWVNCIQRKIIVKGEEIGSDVPFFLGENSWAIVRGRGELIEALLPSLERPFVVVAIPSFKMPTKEAFALLDNMYADGVFPMAEAEADVELRSLIARLRAGDTLGLLPNDFTPVLQRLYPEYDRIFGVFQECGAFGWGITGSGSAAFALFTEKGSFASLMNRFSEMEWIRKILCVE